MPELPDVEGFRRVPDRASGRIEAVEVRDTGILRAVSASRFRRALRGHSFGTPRRHGKWLVAPVRQPRRRHQASDPAFPRGRPPHSLVPTVPAVLNAAHRVGVPATEG